MNDLRLEIVRRLLPQFPEDDRPTENHAMLTWWANIRKDGGMRLTRHGYEMLHDVLKMESWCLEISDPMIMGKREILAMDRKIKWPYFLRVRKSKKAEIVFFSSREAMMATMYGDIKKWLDNL